jgi:hypothetical protein
MRRDARSPHNVIPFPRKRLEPGRIALGVTIGGKYIPFSPELRKRLALIAADARAARLGRRA